LRDKNHLDLLEFVKYFSAMFFDIDSVKEGVSSIVLREPPENFELAYRDCKFPNEVVANLTILRHERKLIVGVKVTSDVIMTCVRCLREFHYNLESLFDFGIELVDGASENVSLWEEDFISVAPHNGIVDITRRVRDALLLEIPMKPLCSSECKGICPTCGVNLNIEECRCKKQELDSPFAILKTLLERKEKDAAPETETLKHKDKKKKNSLET